MQNILANIGFWGMFLWLLWAPVLIIISIVTPRKLLEKYFKAPHFNAGELVIFGSFPGFLMRTAIFCRLFLTPNSVSGRNMQGFVEDSPKWYRLSVLAIVLGAIAHFLLIFLSMGVALLLIK